MIMAQAAGGGLETWLPALLAVLGVGGIGGLVLGLAKLGGDRESQIVTASREAVEAMRATNAELRQTIADRDRTIGLLEQEIERLGGELASLRRPA